MATATFIDDSSHHRGALSVSKASHRIGKLRKAGATGSSAGASHRAPPTVYKIEPEGFRSLVQQLTGPSLPKSSGRLQSMAPPPLAPPSILNPPAALKPSFFSNPSLDFAGSSPKFAFSPLSFSPLADLTPRDSVWASGLESPGAVDIKTLAQLVAGEEPIKLERAAHGSFSFPSKFGASSFEFSSEFNFPSL